MHTPFTRTYNLQYKSHLLLSILLALAPLAKAFDKVESWSKTLIQKDGNEPVVTEQVDYAEHGFIGCLYTDNVCNEDEFCFDDAIFGRCVSSTDDDNDERNLIRFPNLSDGDKALFSIELEKLTGEGYQWTDVYTQCVLQNIIQAVATGDVFDETDCYFYRRSLDSGEVMPDPDEISQHQKSVVPKKMTSEMAESEDSDDEDSYIKVSEDEDGAIMIEPQNSDLQLPEVEKKSSDDFSPFGGYFGAEDEDEDEDERQIDQQDEDEQIDDIELKTYLAMKDALNNAILEESENPEDVYYASQGEFEPEIFWPEEDQPDISEPEDDQPVMLPMKKRQDEGTDGEDQNDIDYSSLDDSVYAIPEIPLYDDYPEYLDYSDYSSPSEDESDLDLTSNGVRRTIGGGLGSSIFNRNERLDVKKPGPFYKNSANNFFLDKLLYSDYDEQYPMSDIDNENNTDSKDIGQVEYEMPLLAPVKDKRVLPLAAEVNEGSNSGSHFVHVATKNKLDTWRQGADFIDFLAREFGLPNDALTDRLIENQHVQFRVESNPQSIDAGQMASRLDQDIDLKKRIDNHIGIDVDRAASGERHDVNTVLFPGGSNFPLLLLVVITASTTAALMVVGVILLLVRRRNRNNRKQRLINGCEEEGGKAQEEYKQLCRDWSRSSKKLESGAKQGQAGSQDAKESNRSSTSSWPDEPNSSNMDISTGHMVLAYMEDHLKNKQRLEQEWVSLCSYEAEPCATTSAFKAENKKKNRYPDKLPYDHNRVILNAMVNASNSDYINASAVTDHDPRNPSYIVTQGPCASTVADFWQMIWEQGCVVIVMLTRLQDNGHQLCHRYWPEEGSEQYHIFEVHLVSEHIWCDDYLVRSVYLKNTRTGETRTVTQFHFRSWPATGVPSSTKALLEFRRKVNKSYRGRSCPICVHCSDGVGRSGTYVLIDMVLNRMSKGCKEIDIAATLEHIRDQRGGMVQSRQQFEFCLMAVAEEVHAILKALPQ